MKTLYFEILGRTLKSLAQALWRRRSQKWTSLFVYLYYLSLYTIVMLISICISKRRAGLLFILYAWFRPVDDILDGEDLRDDKTVKEMIVHNSALLKKIKTEKITKDELKCNDRLLFLAMQLSKELGLQKDFIHHLTVIWDLMLSEYEWKKQKRIPSRIELELFSQMQDEIIFFFLFLVLKIDRQFLHKDSINKMGLFTRVDWLTDLKHDLKTGVAHIPYEKCLEQRITYQELLEPGMESDEKVREFVKEELRNLVPLWDRFYAKKQELVGAVPNKIAAYFCDRFALSRFESEFKNLCYEYGVAYR